MLGNIKVSVLLPLLLACCTAVPQASHPVHGAARAPRPRKIPDPLPPAPGPEAFPLEPQLSALHLRSHWPYAGVGESPSFHVEAVYSDASREDVTEFATLHLADEAMGTVRGGEVSVHRAGQLKVHALYEGLQSAPLSLKVYAREAYEMRAIWVNRWSFKTEADLRRLIQRSAEAGFNAVFLQVRGAFDAYYPSAIEPWPKELGYKDPGFDPLAVGVDEAAAQGVELHAWLNALTLWAGSRAPPRSLSHAFHSHPEWLMAKQGGKRMGLGSSYYLWADPAIPEVRQRLVDVSADIAMRYAVHGIHLDRIRYPAPDTSYGAASIAAFCDLHGDCSCTARRGRCADSRYGQFRRDQVTLLVEQIYRKLEQVAPWVKLTAAVGAIHRVREDWLAKDRNWERVSEAYSKTFQEWPRWLELGIVDAVMPMAYWPISKPIGKRTDFATLTDDAVSMARQTGRHVYMGGDFGDWVGQEHHSVSGAEVLRQVLYTRSAGAQGYAAYDYKTAVEERSAPPGKRRLFLDILKGKIFKGRAVVPVMPWKRGVSPLSPGQSPSALSL